MIVDRKFAWTALLVILSAASSAVLASALAAPPEDCDDGTSSPEKGWTSCDGEIIGAGEGSFTAYNESCEGPLILKFRLKDLSGGMHVNVNVSGQNRYAIGLKSEDDGLLSTYIFREAGTVPSPEEWVAGEPVAYNHTQEYEVEILSYNGEIRVMFNEPDHETGGPFPAIDYLDPDPLPPGRIDFEALNGTFVRFSNVTVVCPSPTTEEDAASEEPEGNLDLGVGYFERPEQDSLV